MTTAPGKKTSHQQAGEQLIRLLNIMERLRGPEGCPWDKRQNPETLKTYLIEEAYEVIDAIEAEDSGEICEELGDLLLQIVFHAQIHSEQNQFSMTHVITTIADKMERRHPHVFGELECSSENELREHWEQIKTIEQQNKSENTSKQIVPRHLPALLKAQKIVQKTKNRAAGLTDTGDLIPDSLKKELAALNDQNREALLATLPQILLAIVGIADTHQIDCEFILDSHLKSFTTLLTARK